MRIKNSFSCVCAAFFAALSALSLVGCSVDYDNGFTEQQIGFIQNFKEIYGEVDITQDWNLAERAKVTVTTSRPSDIKIYAKTNGVYSLVGHYSNVSGTQTLGVDVIEGTTELMVSNGSTVQYTTVGNSVTFGSTRSIFDDSPFVTKTEYRIMGKDVYGAWTDRLTEGVYNRGKEIDNFTYVSTGEFTLYPIYWNTSNKNKVYIYYYDENDLNDDIDTEAPDGNAVGHAVHIFTLKNIGSDLQYKTSTGGWNNASTGNEPYSLASSPSEIKTKGVKINLKAGTVFGIYIETPDGKKYYSNSSRNKDMDSQSQNSKKAVHACTFEKNGHLYLGFEDKEGADSDGDLNDCMFMIEGKLPAITVEEADSWIISAEDLGNTFDIDYNDVVIEVQYTSGEEVAYVTPLAAGGTLASYVYFDNTVIGEIHQLFGAAPAASGSYRPINVDNVRPTRYASTIPIKVDKSFTLTKSEVGNNGYDNATASNMGGFNIKVLQQGETTFDDGKVQVVQNSVKTGYENVPYVICTPKIWVNTVWKKKGHYRWPRESVPMLQMNGTTPAYATQGHSFAEWVADKNKAKDWFAYPYRGGDNYPNTCAPGIVEDLADDGGNGGKDNDDEFEVEFGGDEHDPHDENYDDDHGHNDDNDHSHDHDIDLEDDLWDGWIDKF